MQTNPDINKDYDWNHHHKTFGLSDYKGKRKKRMDKGKKTKPPFQRHYFPEPVILFDFIKSDSDSNNQ